MARASRRGPRRPLWLPPHRDALFELTDVFERGVGEVTDIVEKELFRIAPRTEEAESWALRPEPTAGIARAYVQHGMQTWPQPVKLSETGPMFRYDRPQAGRYRQFWQFDIEAIGDAGPAIDAEIIELGSRFYADAGLDGVEVHLNSIGDPACRPAYVETLTAYYRDHVESLPELERGRLERNVLRLLDSKDPAMAALNAGGAEDHGSPVRRLRRALRRRPGAPRRARCPLPAGAGARPRARLLHADRVRVLCHGPRGPAAGHRWRRAIRRAHRAPRRPSDAGYRLRDRPRPADPGAGRDRVAAPGGAGPAPVAVVVGADPDDTIARLRIATELRAAGIAARAELGRRKLGKQLEAAARDQAHFAVIVGDELASGEVGLRDLPAGTQKEVQLDGLSREIERAHRAHRHGPAPD